MIEGSLLPPTNITEYKNVSEKYLMVWLEVKLFEENYTNPLFQHSEQIKVIHL